MVRVFHADDIMDPQRQSCLVYFPHDLFFFPLELALCVEVHELTASASRIERTWRFDPVRMRLDHGVEARAPAIAQRFADAHTHLFPRHRVPHEDGVFAMAHHALSALGALDRAFDAHACLQHSSFLAFMMAAWGSSTRMAFMPASRAARMLSWASSRNRQASASS